MKPVTFLPILAAVLLLHVPAEQPARAQFGMVTLPSTDFTWMWGNRRRAAEGRSSDIRMTGHDAGFQCDLTARMHASSRFSTMEVRQIENDIRTSMSFIEAAAYAMSNLEWSRDIDWAKLECVRTGDRETTLVPAPEAFEAWIELEVRMFEELAGAAGRDNGHWTAAYTQRGAWRVRRSGAGRRASFTIRPEGLLLPSSLESLEGAAYEICYEPGGEARRTDWEGPAEAQPVNLSSSNDGGQFVLWATIPSVWMEHPGHAHLPAGSPCRTVEDPRREQLTLSVERLRAAGATVEGNNVRLAAFTWEELAGAAQGQATEFSINHESPDGRVALEINATISERPE